MSTMTLSAVLMLCSTSDTLTSVMGGAAPGLKADTSRAYSQPAMAAKPSCSLYQRQIACASFGSMRLAVDQITNQRRSSLDSVSGIMSLEKARTNARFSVS